MALRITPHAKEFCVECATGPNDNNHCAFCGSTFLSLEILGMHLNHCDWYAWVMEGIDKDE